MPKHQVVIIGAGLSGLAAGCYALMNGYDVRIVEHGAHPGGVAATWKRKGFLVDGGVHFFMGWQPGTPTHKLYTELGAWNPDKYRPLDCYAEFRDPEFGNRLFVGPDLDALLADLTAISPKDQGTLEQIIKGAKAFARDGMGAAMERPRELTNLAHRLGMLVSSWRSMRYFTGKYGRSIRRLTEQSPGLHDPWLAEVLQRLFLPEVPVWFVLMLLGELAAGRLAVRTDSCGGFVRDMLDRFISLGGTIDYSTTVEEILVQDHRAVGIKARHKDEEREYRADTVVSAADGRSTLYDMLGGKYLNKAIQDRYDSWKLFQPILLFSYGLNRNLRDQPDMPWSVMLRSPRVFTAGHLQGNWVHLRVFSYGDCFAPQGKTLIQVMAESRWKPWSGLRRDMDLYRVEKERASTEILKLLDSVWPGLSKAVEMTDVATPCTMYRHTRNHQGAWEGFLPTNKALMSQPLKTLPGLDRFYHCGQWVMPGGGVVPCLYSGRHIAQLMCKRDGKAFSATSA